MDQNSSSEAPAPVGMAELPVDMQQVQYFLRMLMHGPLASVLVGSPQVAPPHLAANLVGTPSGSVIQATSAGRVHSTPVTSASVGGGGQISHSFRSSSGTSPLPLLMSNSSSSLLSSDMSSGTFHLFNAASEVGSRSIQAAMATASAPLAAATTVTQSNRVWADDSDLPGLRNSPSGPPRSDTPAPSIGLGDTPRDPSRSTTPAPSLELEVSKFLFYQVGYLYLLQFFGWFYFLFN